MLFVTVLSNKYHLIACCLDALFSIKRILFNCLLSRLVHLWLGCRGHQQRRPHRCCRHYQWWTRAHPAQRSLLSLRVAFSIIWRNVSELFGVVSALRRNASQTGAATNMAAIHKQNQRFTPIVGTTLGSRDGTLVLPRRSSGLSGTPNSSKNYAT
jgi:hypothetical protein